MKQRRPGKEPGASRLAQAIRAAGYTHGEFKDALDGGYHGCVSAWCTGRRAIPWCFRSLVAQLVGWTAQELEEFEGEVRP